MRMTQYTYDCLQRRYTAMTLGTVADTLEGNTISARQLPSGIITGSKLAINSVGIGALQNGSVGSLQIQMAAIQTAHIETCLLYTSQRYNENRLAAVREYAQTLAGVVMPVCCLLYTSG